MLDKEVASRSTLKAKRTPKKKLLAIEPAYVNNPGNPTVVLETLDNSILLRKPETAAQEVVDLEGPQEAAVAAAKEQAEEDRLLMDIELFGSPSS